MTVGLGMQETKGWETRWKEDREREMQEDKQTKEM
jgi:hypothetical protein